MRGGGDAFGGGGGGKPVTSRIAGSLVEHLERLRLGRRESAVRCSPLEQSTARGGRGAAGRARGGLLRLCCLGCLPGAANNQCLDPLFLREGVPCHDAHTTSRHGPWRLSSPSALLWPPESIIPWVGRRGHLVADDRRVCAVLPPRPAPHRSSLSDPDPQRWHPRLPTITMGWSRPNLSRRCWTT